MRTLKSEISTCSISFLSNIFDLGSGGLYVLTSCCF